LILYHGWNDHLIAPGNTVDYYNAVLYTMGVTRTNESVRLFMEPGMMHCRGGDGTPDFDMIPELDNWVEQGKAPDRVVASRTNPDRTRPFVPVTFSEATARNTYRPRSAALCGVITFALTFSTLSANVGNMHGQDHWRAAPARGTLSSADAVGRKVGTVHGTGAVTIGDTIYIPRGRHLKRRHGQTNRMRLFTLK